VPWDRLLVPNLLSFKIHLQAYDDGGTKARFGHLNEALEGNVVALAGGVLANDGFKPIPAPSQLALLMSSSPLLLGVVDNIEHIIILNGPAMWRLLRA
jgi:hypothetical protein